MEGAGLAGSIGRVAGDVSPEPVLQIGQSVVGIIRVPLKMSPPLIDQRLYAGQNRSYCRGKIIGWRGMCVNEGR